MNYTHIRSYLSILVTGCTATDKNQTLEDTGQQFSTHDTSSSDTEGFAGRPLFLLETRQSRSDAEWYVFHWF